MNYKENEMIRLIHEKELFDKIIPAIRQAIKAGGGADAVLKKSETIAATRLIEAMGSEKEEVRLKAATEILNRTVGKPVERSINIYGDISKMDERDVDAQIMHLLEKTGATKFIETTLDTPKLKQKRKPRKSKPLVIDAEQVKGTQPATEAGTTSES